MPVPLNDKTNRMGTTFEELWNIAEDFQVVRQQTALCSHALKFSEWADQLYVEVTKEPKIAIVNQGKLLLQDKYFEWRQSVPQNHRSHSGKGHICISQVYEQAYQRLRAVELSLKPVVLPDEPRPQFAGIILGQLEEELRK